MLFTKHSSLLALSLALISAPAIAQSAHFGEFTLASSANKIAAAVTGRTDGSYDLSIIAKTDTAGNPCIGYASVNPDHVMILEQDLAKLKLQVDSNGKDTTLVVRGPDNIIRCDFGTNETPDAVIEDLNWPSGKYQIWVGCIEPEQNWDYRLSVQAI